MTEEPNINGITFDNIVFESTYKALCEGLELIIQQGGSWSGKTYNVLLAFFVYFKTHQNIKPCTLSIVGPTFSQLRRGALKDFNDIKEKLFSYVTDEHESTHTYRIGIHKIEFFSTSDNAKAADKVKSGKREYVLMDEANLLDWETADLLMGKSDICCVVTYNPYARFWLHEMVLPYMDESKYHFRITTFKDNKHLSQKTIDWLERKRITDPDSYEVLGLGKLGKGKGLIFTDVSYVSELPKMDFVYGLDPGYTHDPTVLIKAGLHQGQLWGKQLLYDTDVKKPRLIKAMIKAGITEYDPIVSDKDFSLINELLAEGFNIIPAKKGLVVPQINRIKEYHINITMDSVDWQKEQLSYRYKKKRETGETSNSPQQNSGMDHCWDAFRYACEEIFDQQYYVATDTVRKTSLIRRK